MHPHIHKYYTCIYIYIPSHFVQVPDFKSFLKSTVVETLQTPHKTYITDIWRQLLPECITAYFFFFFPPFFFPFLPLLPLPPFPPPPSSSSAWAALALFFPNGVLAYQPCQKFNI